MITGFQKKKLPESNFNLKILLIISPKSQFEIEILGNHYFAIMGREKFTLQ